MICIAGRITHRVSRIVDIGRMASRSSEPGFLLHIRGFKGDFNGGPLVLVAFHCHDVYLIWGGIFYVEHWTLTNCMEGLGCTSPGWLEWV